MALGRMGAWLAMPAMLAALAVPAAARAQDWRCDCSRVVAGCSAQVSVEDEVIHFRSSTRACSRVEYFLEGEFRTITFYDGFAAQPYRRLIVPLPGAPQGAGAPSPSGTSPQAPPPRTAAVPLPPVSIRISACRVCYDSAVEYGRRGAAASGDGKIDDPQCVTATTESQRLIQECAAKIHAGIADYDCANRLTQANNRVAALCN